MKLRLLSLAALSALTLLSPQDARAGFLGPSDAAAPTTSLAECSRAEEMTTCVLTGHLTRHERRNRYLFEAEGGRMIVDIPPHVFGQTDVRPEQTIRITGEIGGKRHPDRQDPHLRVRYLEVLP
ncbi:MAG TPA: NirD/YgiW/YdeI family stress tolerance protein [Candidatus Desulfovibrio gallistercoris]|nr:NirD/YgiW/YdeI family stress tolerance protein [Candidatus Desulfovibrio gallistercoris]